MFTRPFQNLSKDDVVLADGKKVIFEFDKEISHKMIQGLILE